MAYIIKNNRSQQWNDILKELKKKPHKSRILNLVTISFKIDGDINMFSDKS